MKYIKVLAAFLITTLFATLIFFIANIFVQNSNLPETRKHGFDNSFIDLFGSMFFFMGLIGTGFFLIIFFAKIKNGISQILIAIFTAAAILFLLANFAWGFYINDTLSNISMLLFVISSICFPVSYNFLQKQIK